MAFHFSRNSRASPICKGWRFTFWWNSKASPHLSGSSNVTRTWKRENGTKKRLDGSASRFGVLSRERSLCTAILCSLGPYDLLISNDHALESREFLLIFRAETSVDVEGYFNAQKSRSLDLYTRFSYYILTRIQSEVFDWYSFAEQEEFHFYAETGCSNGGRILLISYVEMFRERVSKCGWWMSKDILLDPRKSKFFSAWKCIYKKREEFPLSVA